MRKRTSQPTILPTLCAIISLACGAATGVAQRRDKRQRRPPVIVDTGSQWLEFRSQDGGFTARFPEEPWETRQQVAGDTDMATIRTHQASAEATIYQIACSDFAEAVMSSAEMRDLYDEGREANLEGVGVRLLTERDVRLGGYVGREITFTSAGTIERVRWFVVGKRLYEVRIAIDGTRTTAERIAALKRETRRFLDRFKLTDMRTPQFGAEPKTNQKRRPTREAVGRR